MTSECWAGFTDDDIQLMKSKGENIKVTNSCTSEKCDVSGSKSKQRLPMKIKSSLKDTKSEQLYSGYESLTVENPVKELDNNMDGSSYSNPNLDRTHLDTTASIQHHTSQKYEELSEEDHISLSSDCCENASATLNLPSLEEFEMRQKRIEEENARRRALINKAITDKRMRTQAEAIKLAHITQELNRIDSSFSADVAILRDYIEKASQEFSDAEKHYLKVEQEYVFAKIQLFKKMQRKEMLTEHLCAIIEQNENRKANKLVELMKQLELEVVTDDLNVNEIEPILSNLSMLNDECYISCQTLKPSLSKERLQNKMETLLSGRVVQNNSESSESVQTQDYSSEETDDVKVK